VLIAVIYTSRPNATEEMAKRSLSLFTKWQLPAGFEFKAHHAFADGTGGVAIAEAASAAALLEATSVYQPFFEFKTVPVVEISAAVPIFQKVNAWRDSIR
jgi:hypothetical protein